MLRPGLDHPPGWGDEDPDMLKPGVPGIVGRPSPGERPERPLVVPSLLWVSALLGRFRLDGACLAADERRLRWPAEAEKEDWEASVTRSGSVDGVGYTGGALAWLAVTTSEREREREQIADAIRRQVSSTARSCCIKGHLAGVVVRREQGGRSNIVAEGRVALWKNVE